MARTSHATASVKRTPAARTKSNDTSVTPSSSSSDVLASIGPFGSVISLNFLPQMGILVNQSHNVPTDRTTVLAAASFGQNVSIQLRTHIWIPGTIMGVAFSQQYSSYVYDVQFYAADGSRSCRRFFPRDVRSE
ncbi:hypothetical protein L226DRAFT_523132 [Lentinus tigrinus ALCF2SS1-7]|uniref:Uncharacterized protein n=1 Tax=Lentinus tigrinus ALCF2SS1-6 TaxID=1328759 RepID=A0A5C2SAE4_9APHY|nr:hypothetical protein L227DRAFT_563744 [Lentinus tigrinus ALCF2SS1-6]RPD74817.1 hypothetical protein L226DRAFT_523132 [Lentinus tigrinus ALCF2SS1-7]